MRLINQTTDDGSIAETDRHAPDQVDLSAFSDADLLDGWRRDTLPGALETLVKRYSVMVGSVCRRRCRNDADADDAFQTTFLYLARNSHKIRHAERLPGWLHRVAQRAAVATTKSSKRETEPMVEPPDKPDDPLDRLSQRHEAIVLDEELADLPEHYRTALVMHIYDGLPLQQLADHFQTTIGSVRGRLQRAKKMLAQRLRRRGVVPVLAFAAANAWTLSNSGAAVASQTFTATTGSGQLPDPPIETSLLENLLAQGARAMPTIYTTTGLAGGAALIAIALATGNSTHGQTGDHDIDARQDKTIRMESPQVVAQANGGVMAEVAVTETLPTNPPAAQGQAGNMGGMGGGGMGGMGFPPPNTKGAEPGMMWSHRPTLPKPTSPVAKMVESKLNEQTNIQVQGTISELDQKISEATGIPVLIDDRALIFANLSGKEKVAYTASNIPLRTALRNMLRDHGLRAIVEDEGLVITADHAALVQKGIGTSRWINVDDSAAELIAKRLAEPISVEFADTPLGEAIATISRDSGMPIVLDTLAIEEIGFDSTTPITFALSNIKLGSAFKIMLTDLEMTLTIRGETAVVTTVESASQRLLHRIYWLESTGIATDDYQSVMNLITNTIQPETWEQLGGNSRLSPLGSKRPALLISTSYDVHEEIEYLFETLRETHFGVDPVLEPVQVPMQGVGFGGGMGGGMGGGGFF